MADSADRKRGQRDDDQEPYSSPKQGERDKDRRERYEERLEGNDARPVSAAELSGGSEGRHAGHSAEIVCGRRSHWFSCDCAYA